MRDFVGPAGNKECAGLLALRDAGPTFGFLPLFDGVESQLIRSMADSVADCRYAANSLIVGTAERQSSLKLIVGGIVELYRAGDQGGEVAVLLLSSKDAIAPASALLQEPSLICARALTEVRTLEWDAELVRQAMSTSSALTMNLLKITSGQWRMAVRSIVDLGSRSAAQRLGALLLRIADLHHGEGLPLVPISRRHLAGRIGIAPETLSRTLQIVADNGLHVRGRAILVRDRKRLEKFCGPDPYPGKDERHLGVFSI